MFLSHDSPSFFFLTSRLKINGSNVFPLTLNGYVFCFGCVVYNQDFTLPTFLRERVWYSQLQ